MSNFAILQLPRLGVSGLVILSELGQEGNWTKKTKHKIYLRDQIWKDMQPMEYWNDNLM